MVRVIDLSETSINFGLIRDPCAYTYFGQCVAAVEGSFVALLHSCTVAQWQLGWQTAAAVYGKQVESRGHGHGIQSGPIYNRNLMWRGAASNLQVANSNWQLAAPAHFQSLLASCVANMKMLLRSSSTRGSSS